MKQLRTQHWLETAMRAVWDRYFADVPVMNLVNIAYCRPSKTRLGWIALSESGRSTHIGINRLLRHPEVPEEVCIITIAHELVHYSHGFGSPLPQRYADPHAGDIVEQELGTRGLLSALLTYQHWSTHAWEAHYARLAGSRSRPLVAFNGAGARPEPAPHIPTVAALDVVSPGSALE